MKINASLEKNYLLKFHICCPRTTFFWIYTVWVIYIIMYNCSQELKSDRMGLRRCCFNAKQFFIYVKKKRRQLSKKNLLHTYWIQFNPKIQVGGRLQNKYLNKKFIYFERWYCLNKHVVHFSIIYFEILSAIQYVLFLSYSGCLYIANAH